MEQIRELHRHLFGDEMCFDDQCHYELIDDGYFLASTGYQNPGQKVPKSMGKGTKKSGKGTKIRGKGTKIRGKGTKIQGMRLNEAKVWAKGTNKSGKGTTFGGESKKIPQKVCATHALILSSNSHPLARFSEDQFSEEGSKIITLSDNRARLNGTASWPCFLGSSSAFSFLSSSGEISLEVLL